MRYVGTPGMNTICRGLLDGVEARYETRAVAMRRGGGGGADRGWVLEHAKSGSALGETDSPRLGPTHGLFPETLLRPSPQASTTFSSAPTRRWRRHLRLVASPEPSPSSLLGAAPLGGGAAPKGPRSGAPRRLCAAGDHGAVRPLQHANPSQKFSGAYLQAPTPRSFATLASLSLLGPFLQASAVPSVPSLALMVAVEQTRCGFDSLLLEGTPTVSSLLCIPCALSLHPLGLSPYRPPDILLAGARLLKAGPPPGTPPS